MIYSAINCFSIHIEIFIQKKIICVYDQMRLSFNYKMLGNIGK